MPEPTLPEPNGDHDAVVESGSESQNSDGSSRTRRLRATFADEGIRTFTRWSMRIIAVVLVLVLLLGVVPLLKWSLGIDVIEGHLHEINRRLRGTEDTIFVYRYDYDIPTVDDAIESIKQAGIHDEMIPLYLGGKREKLVELWDAYKDFSDNDKENIRKVNRQFRTPITRTFWFSAAPENTEVIVNYELGCSAPTGNSVQNVVGHTVKINQEDVPSHESGKGTRSFSGEALISRDTIESDSTHVMRKHKMILTLFPEKNEDAHLQDVLRIVNQEIARCSFDAMIMVRDLPPRFTPRRYFLSDVLDWDI